MPYKDPAQRLAYWQRPEVKKRRREGMHRRRATNLERSQAREHANYMARRDEITEKKRQQRLENPEARRAYERAWAAANQDKIRKKNRRYKQENPEKNRARNAARRALHHGASTLENVSLQDIWERDRHICHICGKPVARQDASRDHLIPLLFGGAHTAQNIALAHASCNSRRGAGRLPAQLRLFG